MVLAKWSIVIFDKREISHEALTLCLPCRVQSRRRAIKKEHPSTAHALYFYSNEIPKVKNYSPQRSSRLGTNTNYCSDTVHAIVSRSSLLMMTTIFLLWSKEKREKEANKKFSWGFLHRKKLRKKVQSFLGCRIFTGLVSGMAGSGLFIFDRRWGRRYSTEVAFQLPTQPSRVRIFWPVENIDPHISLRTCCSKFVWG